MPRGFLSFSSDLTAMIIPLGAILQPFSILSFIITFILISHLSTVVLVQALEFKRQVIGVKR